METRWPAYSGHDIAGGSDSARPAKANRRGEAWSWVMLVSIMGSLASARVRGLNSEDGDGDNIVRNRRLPREEFHWP